MNIYEIEFESVWPVGNTLIIAAENEKQARVLANETIKHTTAEKITKINISKPCVVVYLSGDY